jgi:hypothetical protein
MIKIQSVWYAKTSDTKSNHLKIIQKIPEQHTGKAQHQGATDNSHTGHCTQSSESTNVKVQKI